MHFYIFFHTHIFLKKLKIIFKHHVRLNNSLIYIFMALKFSSDILDLFSCQYLGITSLATQHGGLINADLAFFMGNLLCNPEET